MPRLGALYSVGIHPWWTADTDTLPKLLDNFAQLATHPQIVMLGECGFDKLYGSKDLSVQTKVFTTQVELSERLAKPLIIHCVRSFDTLLSIRKQLKPTQKWTIHGFRGKSALAARLLAADFDLSFGTHYNPESFALCPPHRRHRESDEDYDTK